MIHNPTPGYMSRENCDLKEYVRPMFTAVLFTIARAQKQPECLLTDEWIKKMYPWNITQMLKE